jgi:hypothetical protein
LLGVFVALKDYREGFRVPSFYRRVIELREDYLFWSVASFALITLMLFGYVFVIWQKNNFHELHLQDYLLVIMLVVGASSFVVINILGIHILKRIQ